MAPDNDHKKEFEDAYRMAHAGWSSFLPEAELDMQMVAGKQWDNRWVTYLKAQGRDVTVFNKMRRVIKMVTGYQRKNRLALKVGPVGFDDDQLSSQWSAVLLKLMSAGPGSGRGYTVLSDAFEKGPLTSGINMVEPYFDFDGRLRFKRLPFNKFLLDPTFTERDLSDCRYILRGEPMSKSDAKMLFPQQAVEIEKLTTGTMGNKFATAVYAQHRGTQDMLRYDEFWQRTTKEVTFVIDRMTGEETAWEGTSKQLQDSLAADFQQTGLYRYATRTDKKRTVELQVYLQDQMFYRGGDPYGLDEYRFVPLFGEFTPEIQNDGLKLQGLARIMRDPQRQFNKRLSQQIDIFESQINTGSDAIENTVVNEDSLYQAGQGKVTWIKKDAPLGLDSIRRKTPAEIPQSMFQLSEQIGNLLDIIPGMNDELFGTEEKQIPGILSKLRTGAALTILQDLFDGYRDAKCLLGHKLIKMVQKNMPPEKIQKLIGPDQQIAPNFYQEDIDLDDISIQEGILTDSQREMYYQELKHLRKDLGVNIPDSAILDAAPVQVKDRLMQHIQAAEQAQQQATAQQNDLTNQLLQSQIAENSAQAAERQTQQVENATSADFDRAKTVAEILKIRQETDGNALQLIEDFKRGSASVRRKPTGKKKTPQRHKRKEVVK